MAGGSLYQDEDSVGAISDINVTPLVDVVLVLLIIFMVTAKLIVARGISVDSPKTSTGADVKSTLQISIDVERKLYVNGIEFTDRASAQAKVREMRGDNPDFKAIIQAGQERAARRRHGGHRLRQAGRGDQVRPGQRAAGQGRQYGVTRNG